MIALKQEVPDILNTFSVCTVKTLHANKHENIIKNSAGILSIITGVGLENARHAMHWISRHTKPLLVINMGSCASTVPYMTQQFISPQYCANESNKHAYPSIGCWPFRTKQDIQTVAQIKSVNQASPNHQGPYLDMESHAFAKGCYEANIAFCCIKYVTDNNTTDALYQFKALLSQLKTQFNKLLSEMLSPPNLQDMTVIIPSYNREAFLKRSIESVLNQTQAIHCIVVDDASTDQTKQMLKHFKDRIKVCTHTVNKGVSAARNTGLKATKSEWVMFLDSDDQWLPTKVQSQCNYIRRYPYFSMLQSNECWYRHHQLVKQARHLQNQEGYIWKSCVKRCKIAASALLIEKQICPLFDEELRACEDYDAWLYLTRRYLVGLDQNQAVLKYAGHEGQLSQISRPLDRYRVLSLDKQLKNEAHPYFKQYLQEKKVEKQGFLNKSKGL